MALRRLHCLILEEGHREVSGLWRKPGPSGLKTLGPGTRLDQNEDLSLDQAFQKLHSSVRHRHLQWHIEASRAEKMFIEIFLARSRHWTYSIVNSLKNSFEYKLNDNIFFILHWVVKEYPMGHPQDLPLPRIAIVGDVALFSQANHEMSDILALP